MSSSTLSKDEAVESVVLRSDGKKPRRRACEDCRRLKVQCIYDFPQALICSRCSKTGRSCIVTQRRRRTTAGPRMAKLERKLEELSATLDAFKSTSKRPGTGSEQSSSLGPPTQGVLAWREASNELEFHDQGGEQRTNCSPPRPSRSQGSLGHDSPSRLLPQEYHSTIQQPLPHSADVIDRGLLSLDAASRAFEHFKLSIMPVLPIVVIESSQQAVQVRRETPVLFLAVLNAASGILSIHVQREINKELTKVLADRLIVVGDKSLGLIQALQVTVVWYCPPERYEDLKYYQLIHIACVMAIDIGISRRGRTEKSTLLIGPRRGASAQRKCYPSSSSVECRRAWLGCYHLAAQTAQSLRRVNLIRWTTYLEECLQALEVPTALPSDRILCHWVRITQVADEVSEQFTIEEPTDSKGLDDVKIKFVVQGFETKLQKCSKVPIGIHKNASIIFEETIVRLFLHQVAFFSGQSQDMVPPFTEEIFTTSCSTRPNLTAGHIESISTCITSIYTIYDSFLLMPPTMVRCQPILRFVRLIYTTIVLIKLATEAAVIESDIGKMFHAGDFKVEYYLDAVIALMRTAAQDDQCLSAGKFSMVLILLKSLFLQHHSQKGKSRAATGASHGSRSGNWDSEEGHTARDRRAFDQQPATCFNANNGLVHPELVPGLDNVTQPGDSLDDAFCDTADNDNFNVLDMDMDFLLDDDFMNSVLENAPPGFLAQFS